MMLYLMRWHISYNVESIEINLLSSLFREKIFVISILEKILLNLLGIVQNYKSGELLSPLISWV